jgi:hypothetical protein
MLGMGAEEERGRPLAGPLGNEPPRAGAPTRTLSIS